jgi:hypothetical protein
MHAFKVRFRLDNGWTRRQMRHVARGRVTLLTFVAAAAMVAGQTEAATFRVDDTRLTVPSILTDDWRAIQHRKIWTRSDGTAVRGEATFTRFLARDYSFSLDEEGFRLRTTWFASGKCVSTDESISSLSASKTKSLESAFGSLTEMRLRLKESPEVPHTRVVIWAHFKSTHEVSLPLDGLASDDSKALEPFAELARQAFDTRKSRTSNCKEGSDPTPTRETARSGGRRMQPSKSQAQSRSSTTRSAPRPTGSLVAGELPQAGESPVRPDRRVDERGRKQEWAILISRFVASPGSLVFEPAGQFTRCVRAYSEAEALAAMTAAHRPQAGSGNGRRTSYTVTSAGAAGCAKSRGDGVEGSSDSGNYDGSEGSESSGGGPSGDGDESSETFQPYADPLDVDSSHSGEDDRGRSEVDDFDFESVPTSDDNDSELLEGELESTGPSPE